MRLIFTYFKKSFLKKYCKHAHIFDTLYKHVVLHPMHTYMRSIVEEWRFTQNNHDTDKSTKEGGKSRE